MTLPATSSIPPPPPSESKPLRTQLTESIILADRVRKSATESNSFKLDCSELVKHVDHLTTMLRSLLRFTTTTKSVYHRPIRHITAEVYKTLQQAYTLLRKCRHYRNFLYRLVKLITIADLRRVSSLLDSSTADLRWLISILNNSTQNNDQDDLVLSLPPIACTDPILAWVWSFTATIQMGTSLPARIEAAYKIASLAKDSDRNKRVIFEEYGVPPLIKLFKEESSMEAQIAGVEALYEIGKNTEIVNLIAECIGIPYMVNILGVSPMRVQAKLSELIASLTEHDHSGSIKEEFGKENVICPLVSLLSFETFQVGFERERRNETLNGKKMSLSSYSFSSLYMDVGRRNGGGVSSKDRQTESPEVKMEVKVNCARALWMLAKDSVENARRISETKGLLCLAKLIENERDVLQKNCVMAIMEITLAAEADADLRRSVFKTNSPVSKFVVEQLLTVIRQSDDSSMKVASIRSIGCLSRTFPARDTRVMGQLVEQLENSDHEIVTEAVIALGKFVNPDNYLSNEHSKTIVEFKVVTPLLRLIRECQRAQIHGLVLLCHLAINSSNNEALQQVRVLNTLRGVSRALILHNPQLRELIAKAVYHLDIYHG